MTAIPGARVEIIGLGAAYGRTRVLDGIRLTVEPGGWLAVIGPNGSGKSTLLRCMLGRQVVADVMARLEIGGLADRPLRTLSGGEQQRAVLARALAQQPRVLLLDEPTAALDLGHAQQVLDLIDDLRRQDGLTVLSTLHDLTLAGQYADRLALLSGGRVAAEGTPGEVLTAAALQTHYGARARVVGGPHGPAVLPVRSVD
jgi:iron complex transport system ATP-binding protein